MTALTLLNGMHLVGTPETALIPEKEYAEYVTQLAPYLTVLKEATQDHTYTHPESSLRTPRDTDAVALAIASTKHHVGKVKTVMLAGIGGSDLGTRAIYHALRTPDIASIGTHPRLVSFGTIEPQMLAQIDALLLAHHDPSEIVLVVASKSGATTETIVNANILYERMCARFGAAQARKQTLIIGNPDTALAHHARTHDITYIAMPATIGGRYSVFTVVGLVPLALLGFDIHAFTRGGAESVEILAQGEQSDPLTLALSMYHGSLKGMSSHELFMWHPQLETLGKWYRQLLAESVGKRNTEGVSVGITPTVAIGSIDLHSHGQLVFGGPKTRVTTHVAVPSLWDASPALVEKDTPFHLPLLAGKDAGDAIRAMYEGVCRTYHSHALPFLRMESDTLDEYALGKFMGTQMASVMLLAHLLSVDAFDQPNVESYKEETRQLLTQ